jgi:hypothetical protein
MAAANTSLPLRSSQEDFDAVKKAFISRYERLVGPLGLAMYFALMLDADLSTGQCFASVESVSALLGAEPVVVYPTLRRLVMHGLIATGWNLDGSMRITLLGT